MLNLRYKNNSTYVPTEYKQYSSLRWLSFLIIFLAIVSVCVGLYLIYRNIYLTIAKTQNSFLFNPNLSQEAIDFDRYEKVMKNWEEKNNTQSAEVNRDPFAIFSNNSVSSTSSLTIDKKA